MTMTLLQYTEATPYQRAVDLFQRVSVACATPATEEAGKSLAVALTLAEGLAAACNDRLSRACRLDGYALAYQCKVELNQLGWNAASVWAAEIVARVEEARHEMLGLMR